MQAIALGGIPIDYSMNSIEQVARFLPGLAASTWFMPNKLVQQTINTTIIGSFLGDIFGVSDE